MKRLQVLHNQKLPYQTSTTTAPYLFSNTGNEFKVCGKGDLLKFRLPGQGGFVEVFTAQCTLVFSAKRGLAIACRPSVRLSVTLVDCDNIGWKSWKLTAQTISPTPSLFVGKRRSPIPRGT